MEPEPCVPTRMNLCCNSDADCPGGKERWFLNPESSYCNDSGVCIECETDEDCGVGSRCDPFGRGICTEPLPCSTSADCGAGEIQNYRVCDEVAGACRPCTGDDECELDEMCYRPESEEYAPLETRDYAGCVDRDKVEVSCLRDQCVVHCDANSVGVSCPNKDPGEDEDMGM